MKVWEKAEKYLSGRCPVFLAVGLLLLSFVPLLWLGKYNVMCIDDYDYGRRVHDVWQTTGSFAASAQEAWRQNMDLSGMAGDLYILFPDGHVPDEF